VSKKPIKSDLARIDRMQDSDIDYSDILPLDKTFLTKVTAAWPPVKKQSSQPPHRAHRQTGHR
jgi:hypothetical protein